MGSTGSRLVVTPTPVKKLEQADGGGGPGGGDARHMRRVEVCPQVPIRRISNCVQQATHTHTHTVRQAQFTGIENDTASPLFLTPLYPSLLVPWAMSPQAFALCLFFFFIDFSPWRDSNLIVVSIFELHMRASDPTFSPSPHRPSLSVILSCR